MDRYSYVYGTLEDGMYSRMDGSEGLGGFFARIKAVNPTITEDIVRNILGGLKKMDGYEGASCYEAPLAVRYAPMHLYKRPDMPNTMEAFCAMSITGAEQREGRDSYYSHIFLINREEMQLGTEVNGRQINYLDQLFGFEWLTAKEMDGHRSKKYPVDFDAVPNTVEPTLRPQDLPLVLQTIRSVYDEKCVIIRLEKNCSFNKRAKQLLIQIYSMMQPRLATEIGFASYQDPAGIQAMSRQTSIRIYLVPAESKIPEFADDSFVVFDLNDPKSIPGLVKDEMNATLYQWSVLPWSQRQEEMAAIFRDTVLNYMDKQLFLERSRNFFNNEFFTWLKSNDDKHTVESLEQLSDLYNRFPILEQSSRAKALFLKKIPSLMKESNSLKQATAQAFAIGLLGENEEQKQSQQQMYMFAAEKLNGADPLAMGVASGRLVKKQTEEKAKQQMDAVKQSHAKEIADLKTAAASAIAAEQAKTQETKAAGEAALAAEKKAAANKMAEMQSAHDAALAEEKQNCEILKAAAKEALQAEKQRVSEANTRADELTAQLTAETSAHTQTKAQLATETSTHAQTKTQLAASQQECETLNSRLQVAAQKFQELKLQKQASDQAAAAAKEDAEAFRNRLASDRKKVDMDLAMAAAKVKEANDAANLVLQDQKKIQGERNKIAGIGIAIGFGIGAVLFGIILAIILLTGKKNEPVPMETLPPVQTEVTEVTVPETTVPEEPEGFVWSDDVANMLCSAVPDIVAVETTDLNDYDISTEYNPVAVFWMDTNRDSSNFAVLMQIGEDPIPEETVAPTDTIVPKETAAEEITVEIQTEASAATEAALAEEASIDETQTEIATTEEAVEATEAAVLEETVEEETVAEEALFGLPATQLVLTSGDLQMVVYGDTVTIEAAIKAFALLEDAEAGTQVIWYTDDAVLPITALLEAKAYAWKDVDSVKEQIIDSPFPETLQPDVQIDCHKHVNGDSVVESLYVFTLYDDADAEAIMADLYANGFNYICTNGYIVANEVVVKTAEVEEIVEAEVTEAAVETEASGEETTETAENVG